MAFNKRILNKIEEQCGDDEVLLDYIRRAIIFELSESKQYKKEYEHLLKQHAKEYEGSCS